MDGRLRGVVARVIPAYCAARAISWALVLHAFPQAPATHTEAVHAPSCFVEEWTCDVAANAANDAFRSVGHPESRAECVEQGPSPETKTPPGGGAS